MCLGRGPGLWGLFLSRWMCVRVGAAGTVALKEPCPALASAWQKLNETEVSPVVVLFPCPVAGEAASGHGCQGRRSRRPFHVFQTESFLHLSKFSVHLGAMASLGQSRAQPLEPEVSGLSFSRSLQACWVFPELSRPDLLPAGHGGPALGCVAVVPRSIQLSHILGTSKCPFAEAA